jgi:hypothetical protein
MGRAAMATAAMADLQGLVSLANSANGARATDAISTLELLDPGPDLTLLSNGRDSVPMSTRPPARWPVQA